MKNKILFIFILVLLCSFSFAESNKLIEKASDSVVTIKAGESLGSGFFVGDNFVLTNNHVVRSSSNVKVNINNKEYNGIVADKDADNDIALIKVDGVAHVPSITIGNSDDISDTEDVYAIGSPSGLDKTTTKGIISQKSRDINGKKFIQIDAVINPGSSGGPLLNDKGEVIGINTMIDQETKDYGFALPINLALEMLDKNNVNYVLNVNNIVESENKEVKDIEKEEKNIPAPLENIKNNKLYLIGSIVIIVIILSGVVWGVIFLFNKKKKSKVKSQIKKDDYSDINIAFSDPVEKPKDNFDDIDIELH